MVYKEFFLLKIYLTKLAKKRTFNYQKYKGHQSIAITFVCMFFTKKKKKNLYISDIFMVYELLEGTGKNKLEEIYFQTSQVTQRYLSMKSYINLPT